MALSGSTTVTVTPNDHNTLVFSWEAVQDGDALTSTINWTLTLTADSSGHLAVTDSAIYPWTVTIDGQEFSGNSNIYIENSATKTLASGSVTLTHNEDGTKSFEYSFSQDFAYLTWSDGTVINVVSGSGAAELDPLFEKFNILEYVNGYIMSICAKPRFNFGRILIPTLASKQTWYKSSTPVANITSINIVDNYTPTGNETESWAADDSDSGSIMCYRNGTALTIAGNGSGRIKANVDSSYAFANFTVMTDLTGLTILDTESVTNMCYMFGQNKALKSLDLSGFKTSSVTNMSNMFIEIDAMTELDLSSFDTSKVTTMHGMFNGCDVLHIVNCSSFDTSAVTDMQYMFNWCTDLGCIFVGNEWDASAANISNMFTECGVSTVTKGRPILDATSMFVQGGVRHYGSENYVIDNITHRIRIGNTESNDIVIPSGTVISVYTQTTFTCNWGMWFIHTSGAEKIAAGQDLVSGTDYADTGWMNSGDTYTVPDDTQFIWLSCRKTDDGSISLNNLQKHIIYEAL